MYDDAFRQGRGAVRQRGEKRQLRLKNVITVTNSNKNGTCSVLWPVLLRAAKTFSIPPDFL